MNRFCSSRARKRFRTVLAFAISIVLTALIVRSLLSIDPPSAHLNAFNLGDGFTELLNATVTIINHNRYRGFNISLSVLQVWVAQTQPTLVNDLLGLVVRRKPDDIVGFKKSISLENYSQPVPDYNDVHPIDWKNVTDNLKARVDTEFNVSLYIRYRYKILFWKTETPHSIFLDLSFKGNNIPKDGIPFVDQKNLTETLVKFP